MRLTTDEALRVPGVQYCSLDTVKSSGPGYDSRNFGNQAVTPERFSKPLISKSGTAFAVCIGAAGEAESR